MILERLTPRGGPRQKAVVVDRVEVVKPRRHFATRRTSDRIAGKQVTERLQVADVRRPQSARRSVPRACHLWSSSTVDPGREQPPCFARAPVPDPVRGLLTSRLSVLLSAPRSRAQDRSRDAVNPRSKRGFGRSLIGHSIHGLDDDAADASISTVETRGEQEGEHRGGTPPPREVFPLCGT